MDTIPINKKKIRSPKQIESFNKMILKRQESIKVKKEQKYKDKMEIKENKQKNKKNKKNKIDKIDIIE
jgi:hypothetical protein